MPEYDNTNTGILFPNDRAKSDKAPQWKGNVNVNGEEYELAAWERTSKKGNKFLSLKVSKKQEGEIGNGRIGDDVPF